MALDSPLVRSQHATSLSPSRAFRGGREAILTFNFSLYWPFPRKNHVLTKVFEPNLIETYLQAKDGIGIELRETTKGVWTDSWFYRNDPVRGILEYGDSYPRTHWYDIYSVVRKPCVPGKEIMWGGIQKIGDIVSAECKTSGVFGSRGWQWVRFNEVIPTFTGVAGTFNDVVVVDYNQTWNGDKGEGARLWFAKGLGQIKAEWTRGGVPNGYGMELQYANLSMVY